VILDVDFVFPKVEPPIPLIDINGMACYNYNTELICYDKRNQL
jgi:hypothetical protein